MLVGAYFLLTGFFILLIGSSIYWDDWTVIGVARELNSTRFMQAGTPLGWTGHLHSSLTPEILPAYRLVILCLWGGACGIFGWITFQISKNASLAFWVAVVSTVAPFNSARIAIINTPAIICVAAFFSGWAMMQRSALVATLLFLFSFTLPSLLFLYAAPFVAYAFSQMAGRRFPTIPAALKLGVFAFLPVAYWTARSIWFAPTGVYEGYNGTISLKNILSAGYLVFLDIKHHVRHTHPGWYLATITFAVFMAPAAASWVSKFQSSVPTEKNRRTVLILAGCGLALLILGTLPYFLVGNSPRWSVWDSRNQILIPFGFSLMTAAALLFFNPRPAKWLLSLLVSISLLYAGGQGYLLWRDGEKQAVIQQMWSASEAVRVSHVVILNDKTSVPFANRRQPGWYELSGMLATAYGNERRIGIEESQWTNKLCNPLAHFAYTSPFYRTGDVPLALTEAPDGVRIIRTTFRDPEQPRPWMERVIRPFTGVRMEVADARGDCDGVSTEE